ncbi:MAG TPA: NAD-dependent epimerase/dehydratase family protein [Chitinophagaceae bacterium]|nr:NAD-dependent epimerase/dehydratase family protein [Chitinophagaceae bacterium]
MQSAGPIKVIITGVTGMVGEGVMHECLQNAGIAEVLIINRKPSGFSHPKLKEIIHKDFFNITAVEQQLAGYDACFFCLGVTSVGKKEAEYYDLTYTLTITFAEALYKVNSNMVFCYISGAGTDSSEKGRIMWARVKGKTENDLFKMPFKKVYAFRPGYLHPTKGLQNTHGFYKYISWMYPILKLIAPNTGSTLKQLGLAMIYVAIYGYDKQLIEVSDIHKLGTQNQPA